MAELLHIEIPTAIGYLELLWHFTSEFAPRGDVGRFSDARIEAACLYKPSRKMRALVTHSERISYLQALHQAGMVDPHPTHRWTIHDWAEHCDDSVRKRVSRSGEGFVEVAGKVTGKRQTAADFVRPTADFVGLARARSPLPLPEPLPLPRSPDPAEVNGASSDLADEYDLWIASYPNRVRVETGRASWVHLVMAGEITSATISEVFAGTKRWIDSEEWARDDGRYIPAPATFLTGNGTTNHGRMWRDHPPSARSDPGPGLPEWKAGDAPY